jgi:hypothetical protein
MVRIALAKSNEVLDRPGCICPLCYRRHRRWYAVASCRFKPGLLWVGGDPDPAGPCFALVSFCRHPYPPRPATTVTLWATRAEAEKARVSIDRTGCGGSCTRRHRIYELGQDGDAEP